MADNKNKNPDEFSFKLINPANERFLGLLERDIPDARDQLKALLKEFNKINKAIASTDTLIGKLSKGLVQTAKSAFPIFINGVLGLAGNIIDIQTKIGALITVFKELKSLSRELKGLDRTISLETAIFGTEQLAANVEIANQSILKFNRLASNVKTIFASAFDPSSVNAWAGQAVRAYADVEEAAYRLSTITVSGQERAIDAVSKNIKNMRLLQKATNDALGSVELLNAQYDIASAGFTGQKENLQVGSAAVNLSQAGYGDLAGSTNALVKALRALGENADNAERRAAQLFETTKVGLLTLDQLSAEVGPLSVMAKNLNISFEEVMASLAGMTTQGLNTAEASVRLVNLLSDIASGAESANKYLAQFRDEAGKPIQINARVLAEKGLAGVVKDLETATKGQVSEIKKIFSNKTSQEALRSLLSLGTESLKSYTERLEQVDTEGFKEEARNRTKTLYGSFQAAFNKAQKPVEEFGEGFGEKIVEGVLESNKALDELANKGATTFGKIIGNIQATANKIGILIKSFMSIGSAVMGIVALNYITKKFVALIKFIIDGFEKLGQLSKESIIENLKQAFINITTFAKTQIDYIIEYFFKKWQEISEKIKQTKNKAAQQEQESQIKSKSLGPAYTSANSTNQTNTQNTTKSAPKSFTRPFNPEEDNNVQTITVNAVTVKEPNILGLKSKQTGATASAFNFDLNTLRLNLTKNFASIATETKQITVSAFKQAGVAINKSVKYLNTPVSQVGKDLFKLTKQIGLNTIKLQKQAASFTINAVKQGSTFVGQKLRGGLNTIGNVLNTEIPGPFSKLLEIKTPGKTFFGKTSNLFKDILKDTVSTVSKMTAILGVAGVSMSVLSGWASAFSNTINKNAVPGVQAIRDNLAEIKDMTPEIKALFNSLDPTKYTDSNNGGQYSWSDAIASALNDISWRWGQVTGKGVATSILEEKARQATDVAESTYQKYIKTGYITPKGKLALNKSSRGLELNSEDIEALKADAEAAKKLKRVEITALEERLTNGNYSSVEREAISKEITLKKAELDKIDKEIDNKFKTIATKSLADAFKNKRLDLPVNFVINEKTIIELETRINTIGEKAANIFNKKNLDSDALYQLSEDIAKVISDLTIQVEADPSSVDALEQQLKQVMEEAGASLGDFIASDPKIREIFNEYLRVRTEQQLKQTDLIRSSKSSKFTVANNLIDSPALAAEQLKIEYEYITAQINILNKELQESSISLTRQLELTSQIKQLEAERARLGAETAVKQLTESNRKKTELAEANQEAKEKYSNIEIKNKETQLSIEQKILDTRKNLINLTDQENQFTLINLTNAKERLDIIKAEYEFKAKQTQIEAEIAKTQVSSQLSALKLDEKRLEFSKQETELRNKLAIEALQSKDTTSGAVSKLLDATNLAQKTVEQNKPQAQATATSTVIVNGKSKQDKSSSSVKGTTDQKKSELKIDLTEEEKAVAQAEAANQKQYSLEEQKIITSNLNKIVAGKFKNPWLISDSYEQYKIYKGRIKEIDKLKTDFGVATSGGKTLKLTESDIFNPDGTLRNEKVLSEYLKNNYNPANAKTIELLTEKRYKAADSFNDTKKEFIRQKKEAAEVNKLNKELENRFNSKIVKTSKNNKVVENQVDLTGLEKEIVLEQQITNAKEKALKIEKQAIESAFKNQQTLNELDKIFGNFAETIELNRALIEQEFALREAIIRQNEGLANSFSSLGSVANNLNSRLGSALTNLGYSSDANKFNILTAREKTQKQITAELELYKTKNKIAQDAVKTLEARGASGSQLEQAKAFAKSSEEALRLAETQAELNLKMVDTQTSLKLLEDVFKTSSIKIEEALNSATDQVDIFKQQLDLIQSNQEVKLNYNSARTDLLQALTGLLGNSQGARAISARFNIDQIDDDTSAKISQSRIDTAKEYLDNQLLQQQIQLEQQAYDNALTQTQLLEDLVKVSSGQQATNITSDDLKSRLQSIPSILNKSIENANKRLNLAKQQETAIIANQETKESAIRLSAIANKLNVLGGVGGGVEDLLNPLLASAANYLQKPKFKIEELPLAIGKSDKFIPEDQKIKPETINKSAMFAELKNLPAVINDLKTAFTQDLQKTGYNSTSINANTVVNISNHYTSNKNTDFNNISQLKNEIISYVNQAITAQMQALSRKVYEYARNS